MIKRIKRLLFGSFAVLLCSPSAWTATNAIIAGQTTNGIVPIGQTNFYSFAGTTNETVTITMVRTGAGGTYPAMDLIAPDGTASGSWANSGLEWLAGVWTYPLPQNGAYVIQCRDNGGDESYAYALTLVKHPGANPGDEDGGAILPGQTITNRIEPGDIDVYTFTATTNETVTFLFQRISDEGRLPYIDFVGPDGVFRTAFWAADTGLEYLAGKWTYQVPANGTYQLLCRDDALTEAYDYTLTMLKHPGPNPGADEGTISAGQTRTNRLDGPADFDIYTFTATTNETVTILMQRMSDEGHWPYIDLVGPDGFFRTGFSGTDTGLEYLAGQWTYQLPANGIYQLLCRDDALTEAYDYTLTLLKHPGPNPGADEGTLVAGQTRTNRVDGPGDFDIYTFSATTNETVTVLMQRMSDEGHNPYIDLVGPDGIFRTAFSGTDSGLEYIAGKWTYRVPANGTYQLLCRDDVLTEVYDYKLTLLKHPGPNPGADAGTIVAGGTVVGQTSSDDIRVYELDVIAGDSILLTARRLSDAGGFLPYMDLVGPDGMLITRGSSIELDCLEQTGRFQVLCRDSDLLGGGGTYELRLHQTPGPPPTGSPPEYLQTFACGNQVVVRWSTNATGFALQQTARLLTPASLINWSNVPPPYPSFAGFNYVTNQSTNVTGFFRLIR